MTALSAQWFDRERRRLSLDQAAVGDKIYGVLTGFCALIIPALVVAIGVAIFAAAWPALSKVGFSIVNAPGAQSYPISSFTWILVYQHQADATKGKKLVDFLNWALTDGEAEASTLDYAPLPAEMASKVKERVATIDYSGAK